MDLTSCSRTPAAWTLVLIIIFILGLVCDSTANENGGPIAATRQGVLIGKYLKSRDGRTYSAYLGVPYAQAPKRFKNPEPPKKWEGMRPANKFGAKCPQIDFLTQKNVGREDCLFLNVYTPDVDGRFPVMFYIHGGGFAIGAGSEFGAKYYMDEDVVLVTINYRLGALGFLSTGDEVILGNFGLKDQTLALEWVQENIKNFGGDKSRVTIFGESAGGASVGYHILSEKSKGLFQKAISQSGSPLNPWAFTANPRTAAGELATKLYCANFNSFKMAECLYEKTTDEILQAQKGITKWFTHRAFGPTVEYQFESGAPDPPSKKDAFLTESPAKLFLEGRFNKVPHIITAMKDEGLLLFAGLVLKNDKLTKDINEDWLRIAPITCYYDNLGVREVNAQNELSAEIRKYYFGDKIISMDTYENLTNMYSDRLFLHGIQKQVLLQTKAQGAGHPVFAGLFSFSHENSFHAQFGIQEVPGAATHGDDIIYHHWPGDVNDDGPFGLRLKESAKGSDFEKVSKMLVKLWVSFAAVSSSPELKLKIGDKNWPKVTMGDVEKKSLSWTEMTNKPKMIKGVYDDRVRFWDGILDTHQQSISEMITKDQKDEL